MQYRAAAEVIVIGSDGRVHGNNAPGGGSKNGVGRSDSAFLLHVYADHGMPSRSRSRVMRWS